MNIRKGPAILAAVTAVVVVVGIVLLSGGEKSEAPKSGPDEVAGQQVGAGDGAGGEGSDDQNEGSKGDGSKGDQGSGGSGSSGGGSGGGSGVPVVEVQGGEPVGGVQELEFESGEEIRFAVASDAADEIHFHGYDLYADVPAGGQGEIRTPAEIEGVFEVELHDLGIPVAEVTVSP